MKTGRHAVNKHIKGVHQERLKCDQCSKELSNRRNLKAHILQVHETNRKISANIECFLCHKLFSRNSKRDAHMEKMRCSLKPKLSPRRPCKYKGCVQLFTTKSNMLRQLLGFKFVQKGIFLKIFEHPSVL